MNVAAKLPASLRRSQGYQKRELVSKVAKLPPDAEPDDIRRCIAEILDTARAQRLAGNRTLQELRIALRRSLLKGNVERARDDLLEVIPETRPNWPRILFVLAVTLGAISLEGTLGWLARALLVALLSIQLLATVLESLLVSQAGKRWELETLRWLEARLGVRDRETALAAYRELRSRVSEHPEEDAQTGRVMQASALYQLACSSLDFPLKELAEDARSLAELPGSNEHWWTARALATLADKLAPIDPEESAKLRDLHARVKLAADALAARLAEFHRGNPR